VQSLRHRDGTVPPDTPPLYPACMDVGSAPLTGVAQKCFVLWHGDQEAAAVTALAGPFTMSDLDLPAEQEQLLPQLQGACAITEAS